MDIKKILAKNIVSQFHNEKLATESELTFLRTIQQGDQPENIQTLSLSFQADLQNTGKYLAINLTELLTSEKLANSKSEAKRLLSQNAVYINGVVQTTETTIIKPNDVIKVGRRRFLQITDLP